MSRVALLDVNVLVALFCADHVHHELAHDWFADHRRDGWATCPLTENGFLRIVTNPATGIPVQRPVEVLDRLCTFRKSGHHRFWPDSVSLADTRVFNASIIRGHRQVSDIYLLGLAAHEGGALATFDRTIPLAAVRGATKQHLQLIGPADQD
jgi:toxin-antitoxin system PIN domain toxin